METGSTRPNRLLVLRPALETFVKENNEGPNQRDNTKHYEGDNKRIHLDTSIPSRR
jgi:hypothetical protein